MANTSFKNQARRIGQSPGLKLVIIVGLIGILTIGLGVQVSLISERRGFRDEAWNRTVAEWGGRQGIVGPVLRIPVKQTIVDDQGKPRIRESLAVILPQSLDARVRLDTETRSRGIYEIPLYTSKINLSGVLAVPQDLGWLPAGATVDWSRAQLYFFVSEARGLTTNLGISLGETTLAMTPAVTGKPEGFTKDAFAARLDGVGPGSTWTYRASLELHGGDSFGVFPAGADTNLTIASSWKSPEFGGEFLPTIRRVDDTGFEATWRIPALARSIPNFAVYDDWVAFGRNLKTIDLGLMVPVDAYRLSERSVKYGLLFIIIPFAGLFLYEILARRRVHPIQYGFVGLAVLMFYLLLLSFSERIGFTAAFAIGGGTVSLLLGAYAAAILKGGRGGIVFSVGMAFLYGLLYIIVSSEDNALVVGSVFLLSLLAAVMMITRHIDWYAVGLRPPRAEPREPAIESETKED